MKRIIELKLGERLQAVKGCYKGFLPVLDYQSMTGYASIELKQGETLHQMPAVFDKDGTMLAPAGWIVQPAGAPSLSTNAVTTLSGKTATWVRVVTLRGGLAPQGGLQGYTLNKTGDSWVPKVGYGTSGRETKYYPEDVKAWISTFGTTKKRAQNMEVPPTPLYNLFRDLGNAQQRVHGYVTRTRVLRDARDVTNFKDYPQNQIEYSRQERRERFGLLHKLTERDYPLLRYVAEKEGWKDAPLSPERRKKKG